MSIFASTAKTCPTTANEAVKSFRSKTTITTSNATDTFEVFFHDLVPDCPDNTNRDFLICALVWTSTSSSSTTEPDFIGKGLDDRDVIISYDNQKPAPPTISSIQGGDTALYVKWDAVDDVDKYVIHYAKSGDETGGNSDPCSLPDSTHEATPLDAGTEPNDAAVGAVADDAGTADGGTADGGTADGGTADGGAVGAAKDAGFHYVITGDFQTKEVDGANTSGTVEGLVNGQKYAVYVTAIDFAGNESDPSKPYEQIPENVQDFYRRYRCEGGNEKGGFGCSTAGMAIIPAAGIAALAFFLRRRSA